MGAQRVKGITIEIDGDATGLDKALKDVNSSISSTQKELRDVNKLLQLDPGNAELIAQKQRLLGNAIADVKTKLDTLKIASEQANEALASGSINQNQYDALQREIVDTTNQLKRFEAQQREIGKDTSGLEKFSSKCQQLGESLKAVSAAATLALAGITGMAVEAGKMADDLNTMAKQTGLSTEALQKMAYASDLIDVDMNTITSSISKMKRSLESQAETFDQIGVKVKDQKGEYRDIESIFYETVQALGNIKNETERDTLAMKIFGKSADELAGLIDDGGQALRDLGDEAKNMDRLIPQETLDAANEFNDTLDRLKATLKADFAKAGTQMAAALAPAFKQIASAVMVAADALSNINPAVLAVVAGILLIVAAAAKFLIAIGKIATGISALQTALPVLSEVISSTVIPSLLQLNATIASFAANPVVLGALAIVAALALIGIAVYEVIKNWDDITAATDAAMNNIKTSVEKTSVGATMIRQFEGIKNAAKDSMSTVESTFESSGGGIKGAVEAAFSGATEGAKSYLASLVGISKDQLNALINLFGSVGKDIVSKVREKFSEIKEAMVSKIKEAVDSVINYIKELPERAKDALHHLADKVAEPFEKLADRALGWGKDLVDNFANGISKNNKAVDAINGMAQDVQDRIGFSEPDKGPLSRFHTFAPDMIDLWVKGVKDNMYKVANATNTLASSMNPLNTVSQSNTQQVATAGGYGTMNVYVDHISELSDLVRIQNQAQQRSRMGVR